MCGGLGDAARRASSPVFFGRFLGTYSDEHAVTKSTEYFPVLQRLKQWLESAEPLGPVSCHHPRRLVPVVSARSCVPVLSSPVQDSSYYKLVICRSDSRHRRLDWRCSFNF
jgi:hypothetical protein